MISIPKNQGTKKCEECRTQRTQITHMAKILVRILQWNTSNEGKYKGRTFGVLECERYRVAIGLIRMIVENMCKERNLLSMLWGYGKSVWWKSTLGEADQY